MNFERAIIKFFHVLIASIIGFLFYNILINFLQYKNPDLLNSPFIIVILSLFAPLVMNIILIIMSKFIYGEEKIRLFRILKFGIHYDFKRDFIYCVRLEFWVLAFYTLFTLASFIIAMFFRDFSNYILIFSPMYSFIKMFPSNLMPLAFIVNLIFNCALYLFAVMLIRYIFFKIYQKRA